MTDLTDSTNAQKLGRTAEDLAAEYLVSLGWRVLARNVRNHYGELDIVAFDVKTKPQELVIIEVRCRSVGKVQGALDSVSRRKIGSLKRASCEYVDSIGWTGFWRIDLIGITLHERGNFDNYTIEHVKDITS
ncbi:MAG: YraN family protein [Synergistaceae bacterium]|nr:YraN family protein [Synergistaceae bacterium]